MAETQEERERRHLDLATARMLASYRLGHDIDMSWAEAQHLIKTTFIGRQMLLSEAIRDLGRALYAALPGWFRRRWEIKNDIPPPK